MTMGRSGPGDGAKLRFVNRSLEARTPNVVVWQRNCAPGAANTPVAWRVIRRCGYEWTHPFDLPEGLQVRIRDHGGSGRLIPAPPGAQIRLWTDRSGRQRLETVPAGDPSIIQIGNLTHSAVAGEIWRGGRLLAVHSRIPPGAVAPSRFSPSLTLSAVSGIDEGDPLAGRWLGNPTELDLRGVVRAQIMMVGGGPGASSRPLIFHLVNAERWPR